jgi:ribosomal-protein-alanine N-acetyltransferase
VPVLTTERLELKPLPAKVAALLPEDKDEAATLLGATLPTTWPEPNLLGLLRLRPPVSPAAEAFGVWVMIESAARVVVGDIGFKGPPDEAGAIEMGYSVTPDRRRRGYATEAAGALAQWALRQPHVRLIVARCAPDNVASIRALERVGFTRAIGAAPGEIRWHYGDADRDAHAAQGAPGPGAEGVRGTPGPAA